MMSITKTLRRHPALTLACAALAVLALPEAALAIPGSGDFTALSSPSGREISSLYNMLAKICLVIFAIVSSFMLVAIVRYRRRSEDEMPEQVHGNMKVEMGLLVAATLLQVFIGWKTIETMWYVEKMPEGKLMVVEAIAKKWDWKFRYPDHGGLISEDLVIPAHTNVKLEITSEDVIHSIFIPELGVKMDAVPGRYNYWWFNADGPINQVTSSDTPRVAPKNPKYKSTRPDGPLVQLLNALTLFEPVAQPTQLNGLEQRVTYLAQSRKINPDDPSPYEKYDAVEYRGMCTELCGSGHYNMYFRTVAMTPASFDQWIKDMQRGSDKPADGAQIYNGKCASCHQADGNGVAGNFPPLAGSEWVNQDNEENKRRHIEVVLAGLKGPIEVKGVKYNGQMNSFYSELNDDEVAAVVNHERVSWGNAGGTVTAEQVAEERKRLGYPAFPAGGAEPVDEGALAAEGADIYNACASCHGADGKGVNGRYTLAGNPTVLASPKGVVEVLLKGAKDHPAMGQSMNDRQLAAITTYLRKSFGNTGSGVQPDEIKRYRGELMPKP